MTTRNPDYPEVIATPEVPVGITLAGDPFNLDSRNHLLIVGEPGSGKSNLTLVVAAGLAQRPDVQLVLTDAVRLGIELRPLAERAVRLERDLDGVLRAFFEVRTLIESRLEGRHIGNDIVVLFDELDSALGLADVAHIPKYATDEWAVEARRQALDAERLAEDVEYVLTYGHLVGVFVVATTLRTDREVFKKFTQAVVLGRFVNRERATQLRLPNFRLDETATGRGVLYARGAVVAPFDSYYLSNTRATAIAAATAHYNKPL